MFSHLLQRWEIKASTGSHFDVLDGIRGVAILMVVVFHTFFTNADFMRSFVFCDNSLTPNLPTLSLFGHSHLESIHLCHFWSEFFVLAEFFERYLITHKIENIIVDSSSMRGTLSLRLLPSIVWIYFLSRSPSHLGAMRAFNRSLSLPHLGACGEQR